MSTIFSRKNLGDDLSGSNLPKKSPVDRLGIDRIENIEDVKKWLRRFADEFDRMYKLLIDQAEAGGFRTANWQGIEVGDNLEFQKKVTGTYTKKGAVTGA